MQLTNSMCELIGSIIGDGNIYDKRPSYVEITGHPQKDKDYFENFLTPIIKNELQYSPKLSVRSNGLRLRINNKKFVSWLKELGIPSGAGKFKRVLIPHCIANNLIRVQFCLRGIFDTDGCIHFDKRKIYKKPYVRIELNMYNPKLLLQIMEILKKYKLKPTFTKSKPSLYLNGYRSVESFLRIIGFSNKRHISRIEPFHPELIGSIKPL